jgi:solute carrier family 25 (adenine nucleotide translocator) protein 4/5/6/31
MSIPNPKPRIHGNDSTQKIVSFAVDLTIGGLSAMISKFIAFPFNRARLIQQNHWILSQRRLIKNPEDYNGHYRILSTIAKREGYRGLFHGYLLDMLRYFPVQIVNKISGAVIRKVIVVPRSRSHALYFLGNLVSGGAVGGFSLLCLYPLDVAITQISCDSLDETNTKYRYSGAWDVISTIYRKNGLTALYRGFVLSVAGIVIYRGTYFGLYDILKPIVLSNSNSSIFLRYDKKKTFSL